MDEREVNEGECRCSDQGSIGGPAVDVNERQEFGCETEAADWQIVRQKMGKRKDF